MPKYALLLGGADIDKRAANVALAEKMYERFTSWMKAVRASGHTVDAHALKDQSGARLSVRGGEVVEGPFMETKEAIGGILFVDADSLEDAIAIARGCPVLDLLNGYIEVRVVAEVRRPVA